MSSPIRIVLAEDHGTVREGIKLLLEGQDDIQVVGEAADGEAALRIARALRPDLLVLDISMPDVNGLTTTRRLKRICPEIKIVMLTRHTGDGYLHQLVKAGADGYVLKQSDPSELLKAIRAIACGYSYIDTALTSKMIGAYVGRAGLAGGDGSEVTNRETEILRLVAWGYSNKDISTNLDISVKTVETHKGNVMRKLGMKSRIDIVRYAVLNGWLEDS